MVLLPFCCSLKYIHLWHELYCRYDETQFEAADMAAGNAVGKVETQMLRMTVGVPTLKGATGVSTRATTSPQLDFQRLFLRYCL